MILETRPYSLLRDSILKGEAEMVIARYIEQFMCKDSPIPCGACRDNARKLAPLFLQTIEIIGLALEQDSSPIMQYLAASADSPTGLITRAVFHLVKGKLAKQKWTVERPWKQTGVPSPVTDKQQPLPFLYCGDAYGEVEEVVSKTKPVFKLAKRTRGESK